jgi:hypothetical protein
MSTRSHDSETELLPILEVTALLVGGRHAGRRR